MFEHMSLLVLSFLLVFSLMPLLIRFLKLKGLTQPIRKELPDDHQSKKGTPLMAGLIFYPGVVIACILYPHPLMFCLTAIFVLFGGVGFLDDFKKAWYQDPGGISGKAKLVMQFLFSGVIFYILFAYFHLTKYKLNSASPLL